MLHAQRRLNRILHTVNSSFSTKANEAQYPNSYTQISQNYSQDLSLKINILKHNKSGALIYNLINKDENNCFAPIVKTLPKNDTGCAHILEHLACCGSQRYPIRDPFFNMLKRSINTYMNAWTGEDFTAYPFSSANLKDFRNLYQVYLDLCLKPNLNQLDFRQQGWRYEYNASSQKQIKGIVFNQMKGAYQNPQRQMYIQISNKLFSGTPYQYDSGGKPSQIVKLSYEELRSMHSYYYHPSNASFFYYGNQNIKDNLSFLQSEYLSRYQNQQNQYKVEQNLISKNDNFCHQFISSSAESISLALAYNLGSLKQLTQPQKYFLQLLTYFLVESNPILHEQFIQTGFADSLGSSGFQSSTFCTFKVYLKNVHASNVEDIGLIFSQKFEEIISKICQDCEKHYKIDVKKLEEYFIQNQINLLTPKDNNGIDILMTSLPYMNNRLQLTNLIDLRNNAKLAVQIMKDRSQRQKLLQKFFLNNKRKVVIKQIPKAMKTQQNAQKIIGLDMPEQIIKKQQQQLKLRQQSSSDNSNQCLPSLKLSDIASKTLHQYKIINKFSIPDNPYTTHKQVHVKIDNDNINFFRFVWRLPIHASDRINKTLSLLDLWKYTITKGMGLSTATSSNKDLISRLKKCSSNFDITIQKDYKANKLQQNLDSVNIIFNATCLRDTVPQFIAVFREILYYHLFKVEDCQNSFRGYMTDTIEHIVNMPMKECIQLCSAMITGDSTSNSYYWLTQGLKNASNIEKSSEFSQIFQALLQQSQVTLIEHSVDPTENIANKLGIQSMKGPKLDTDSINKISSKQAEISSIAVTHNYDVNFCTQQYPAPKLYTKQHANLTLFLEILEQDYLHPKIREQGGAYGARAQIRKAGTIVLYSYMDPYAQKTFQAFDSSIEELLKNQFTVEQLEQVKIKVLGHIDQPITPQNQCLSMIIDDVTAQQKQNYRRYILESTLPEIMKTSTHYLEANKELKKRVVFGKQVPSGFHHQLLQIPQRDAQQIKQ